MSAADLGRRLLKTSVEKNLGEVLGTFQLQCRTPYSLPALEDLFHGDTNTNPGGVENHQPSSSQKLPIIELCSEESGAGKTQFLYLITTIAILPEVYADIDLGGRNCAVVILDTEGRFGIQRLVQVMRSYVLSKDPSLPNINDLIYRSLQHVHIYQPQSLASLIAILSTLQTYLFTESREFHRALHSIIIDTTSAFYWQYRADLDTTLPTTSSTQNPYATLCHHLRTLAQTFKCSIITTSHAFSSTSKDTGEAVLRTLPPPWSSLPTVRLCFARDQVKKFPIRVSAEEALREQRARMQAVEKSGFSACTFDGRRVFGFMVGEESVEMG